MAESFWKRNAKGKGSSASSKGDSVLKNKKVGTPSNPWKDAHTKKITWDCVWFGHYPQVEVVSSSLMEKYVEDGVAKDKDANFIVSDEVYSQIQNAMDWDENNDITIGTARIRRVSKSDVTRENNSGSGSFNWESAQPYHYYVYQPLKWRVFRTDGNTATMMAEKVIDCQKFNENGGSVTWAESTVRSWLNKEFTETAFGAKEGKALLASEVAADDNDEFDVLAGDETSDRVYLLSYKDVSGVAAPYNGFDSDKDGLDNGRKAKATSYAKCMGVAASRADVVEWWLRTPGDDSDVVSNITEDGNVDLHGSYAKDDKYGIRPAIKIDITDTELWAYAGSVTEDGEYEEQDAPDSIVKAAGNGDAATLAPIPEKAAEETIENTIAEDVVKSAASLDELEDAEDATIEEIKEVPSIDELEDAEENIEEEVKAVASIDELEDAEDAAEDTLEEVSEEVEEIASEVQAVEEAQPVKKLAIDQFGDFGQAEAPSETATEAPRKSLAISSYEDFMSAAEEDAEAVEAKVEETEAVATEVVEETTQDVITDNDEVEEIEVIDDSEVSEDVDIVDDSEVSDDFDIVDDSEASEDIEIVDDSETTEEDEFEELDEDDASDDDSYVYEDEQDSDAESELERSEVVIVDSLDMVEEEVELASETASEDDQMIDSVETVESDVEMASEVATQSIEEVEEVVEVIESENADVAATVEVVEDAAEETVEIVEDEVEIVEDAAEEIIEVVEDEVEIVEDATEETFEIVEDEVEIVEDAAEEIIEVVEDEIEIVEDVVEVEAVEVADVKPEFDFGDEYVPTEYVQKFSQSLSASISPSIIRYGKKARFLAGGVGEITFTSSDSSIATIDNKGEIIAKRVGSAMLTMHASGDDDYEEAAISLRVTVVPADLQSGRFAVSNVGNVYSGEALTPAVKVIFEDNELVRGADFKVDYIDNINAGEAAVKVTGVGNYAGSLQKTFEIAKASQTVDAHVDQAQITVGKNGRISAIGHGPVSFQTKDIRIADVTADGEIIANGVGEAVFVVCVAGNDNYEPASCEVSTKIVPISIELAEIELLEDNYVYTGKKIVPSFVVRYEGKELIEGADYKVSYKGNVDAGMASLIVSGIGNFAESKTVGFRIVKAEGMAVARIKDKSIVVDCTGQLRTKGYGDITYVSTNTSVATVSETGLVTAENVGTVDIRVISSGDDNHLGAETVVTIEVEPIDASDAQIIFSGSNPVYTGSEVEPAIMVQYDGETLVRDRDYTVSCIDNVDAGKATAVITCIGNYTGKTSRSFVIEKAHQQINAWLDDYDINVGEKSAFHIEAFGDITCSTSAKKVLLVNGLGEITAKSAGTATITIIATGDENHYEASSIFDVRVH